MTFFILSLSTILQFTAAFLAIRLVRVTEQRGTWTLFAIVLLLMGFRRCISLFQLYTGEITPSSNLSAELIALTISMLLVTAVYLVDPAFRSFLSTRVALRRSEEKFRETVDMLPQAVYEINLEGEVVFTNIAGRKLLGLEGELGNTRIRMPDLVVESDRYRANLNVKELLEGKPNGPNEYTTLNLKGEQIPVLAYSGLIREDGEVTGLRTLVIDISELKKTQQELKASETLLKEANKIARLGSWEKDMLSGTVIWSEETWNILGLNPAQHEPSSELFSSLVHPDDRENTHIALQELLNDKKPYDQVLRIILNDGSVKFLHERGHAFYDEDDRPVRTVGTLQDITERLLAEERLTDLGRIFDTSLNELYIFKSDSLNFVQANQSALNNLGYSMEELKQLTPAEINPNISMEQLEQNLQALRSGEVEKLNYETSHIRKDGTPYEVELHLQYLEHVKTSVFLAVAMDITERRKSENELRKLSQSVEASSTSVIITDFDGLIEYVNPNFTETTGYQRDEVIGKHIAILRSGETPERVFEELWKSIRAGGVWKGELRDRKKDGSLFWARVSISGIKDVNGKITHFISNQEDVTHEYVLSEQLSYQASHDSLTGLVNRREFERRAERLLGSTRRDNSEHALCYMDLDQFKVVNDTCGHTAGDEMMRQIATLLQGVVRKRDTLARFGGDEFGVLMEHCSPDHAHRVASNLQKAIQDFQFSWEGHVFRIGVSIGLIAITDEFSNLSELLRRADLACYMAKDMGRNRIHVYHDDDSSVVQRHGEMQWVTRIYQALEKDRFVLFAQKIESLSATSGSHYELLIRMKNDDGELIPPGAFLPAAERYSVIEQIDAWVIENTLRLLSESRHFLEEMSFISINLSGQSMTRPDILDFIVMQLDRYSIPAEKICFEITETTAITNLSTASGVIKALKERGCRFALDDFGSGLSSFGYLKNLPVDYLKIDGMFVKDIVEDPIDHAMVKSINEIGQVMGMGTIAEFVENDEIKGMLREIGVNYAQGYGIAKPVEFNSLLSAPNKVTNIDRSDFYQSRQS